jgi:phosphatidylglycerophosphate synthase
MASTPPRPASSLGDARKKIQPGPRDLGARPAAPGGEVSQTANRRPLKSRDTGLARGLAAALARAGVQPDAISAGSVLFALALLAALGIQLRLLCNLLDGMVAVEHGRGGPDGPIWNELPDRFADVLLLASAGYGAERAGVHGAALAGWICAVLALLTAYLRELGRALGFAADFSGPMAKPHRMAVLTLACLLTAVEPLVGLHGQILGAALLVIAAGAAVTVARRLFRLAARLRAQVRG